jgi:hypothetical protein
MRDEREEGTVRTSYVGTRAGTCANFDSELPFIVVKFAI